MDTTEERLQLARRLLQAIESGDTAAEGEAAAAIARQRISRLHVELHRITGALRDALCNVHVTGELARLAQRDLPDAQVRLNQVIGLTEDAAHRTLTAVEASLPLAEGIADTVARFRSSHVPRVVDDALRTDLEAMLVKAGCDAVELKACLSEVMMAQSFQDITGQILQRVVELVAELERIVGSGESDAPIAALRPASNNAGFGPALPGRAAEGTVGGQQAIDDLLIELGV